MVTIQVYVFSRTNNVPSVAQYTVICDEISYANGEHRNTAAMMAKNDGYAVPFICADANEISAITDALVSWNTQ